MKKLYAIIVALACAPAFASGIGNTYNTTNNTPTAHGGQGGAGGRGGDGGSVLGSGNSSNLNSNTNMQGQAQGQMQGQAAIGVGVGGTSSATSGSSSGASATSGGNTLTGGAQTATQANSVTVTGDTYQAQERNPVSTAWAPNVAPTALCALGVSGGAQGVSFGLSFGKAYIDDNCQLLEQVRATATVLGDRATAAEMMCSLPAYKEARTRAGKPCGGAPAMKAAAIGGGSSDAPVSGYTGNDPYVMKRLAR